MAEITKGTTYYLEALLTDQQGYGVTGLTVTYKVIRSSDNFELASGTLNDVGDGVYQDSYLFSANGQFRIVYFTPENYNNKIETVNVTDANNVSVSNKLDRILGLCQENFKIIQPTYNQMGDLVDGIIKIFDSPEDLEADVNPIAVYEVKTTYKQGKNRRQVQEYQVKRIS